MDASETAARREQAGGSPGAHASRRGGGGGRIATEAFGIGWLVALVCSSVLSGLTLAHVLQSPGSRGLSGPEWLAVQHTFYGGFAIVGGVVETLGLVVAAVLAGVLIRRRWFRVAIAPGIAALCFLGALLSFWFGNRPANTLIARWTSTTLPVDWSLYRASWENAHAITAALAAIAFLALAGVLVRNRDARRGIGPCGRGGAGSGCRDRAGS